LFTLGSFKNIYRSSYWSTFPTVKWCINFGIHRVGRLFHKHIWSPWMR
jgi:hypothetical protein